MARRKQRCPECGQFAEKGQQLTSQKRGTVQLWDHDVGVTVTHGIRFRRIGCTCMTPLDDVARERRAARQAEQAHTAVPHEE